MTRLIGQKGGKIILGGCIVGPNKHEVVCSTCRLEYQDDETWHADHGILDRITTAEAKKLLSIVFSTFPTEFTNNELTSCWCSLEVGKTGALKAEKLHLSLDGSPEKAAERLKMWLPPAAAIREPDEDGFRSADAMALSYGWVAGKRQFEVNFHAEGEVRSSVTFGWRQITE